MVTALLAERAGVRFKAHRSGNDIAEGRLAGVPVTLARPRCYMNLSGKPVAALAAFYKIPPDRLVVIHDELDIGFGALRLKFGGGDNGHNGLRSISQALGTRDYYRVRFGIGRPPGRLDAASYVLRDFSPAERKELPLLVDRAADATEALITKGVADAQNIFHPDWPQELPRLPAMSTRSPVTWPSRRASGSSSCGTVAGILTCCARRATGCRTSSSPPSWRPGAPMTSCSPRRAPTTPRG